MKPEIFKLKNGLKVVFIDTKAFPTLTTLLLVGSGSRYENTENSGISHFLEHMFFKGSEKYPDPYTISSTIESLGGIWNAFTSKDHTGYWVKAATVHFPKVIDFLSDILLRSKFPDEQIKKEKGVIVEEMNMYEDQPQMKVEELFENLLYKGHPLGFDVIGNKKTVTSFNRDTFVNYMGKLYYPNNSVLVLAGGLNHSLGHVLKKPAYAKKFSSSASSSSQDAVFKSASFVHDWVSPYMDLIEQKFGGWEPQKIDTIQKIKEEQNKPGILVYEKKTEQAHFCLGFRTFDYFDDRKYALGVLAAVLGAGASSRLFTEVREKRGLCYYISTGNQYYSDVGNMVTQAGVPKTADKVKEAITATLKEHYDIAKGVLKKEEVAKAKEIIKGRLLLSMEDSFRVAHYFGAKKLLQDSLATPLEEIEKFEKVKIEEVIDLAKGLFVESKLNLSIIGPFKEKEFDDVIISNF